MISQSLKHKDYYWGRFCVNNFEWSTEGKKLYLVWHSLKDFLKIYFGDYINQNLWVIVRVFQIQHIMGTVAEIEKREKGIKSAKK